MTTYRCAACSTILEVEKLPLGNTVEVTPCEACLEAAEEAALDAADAKDFEVEGVETGRITELGESNIKGLGKGEQTMPFDNRARDYLKEICAHCGLTKGSHHSGSSPWPHGYCPGHEGRMDWQEGPGTVFAPTGKFKREGEGK